MKPIAAIIPAFNCADLSLRCIDHLRRYAADVCRIVFVDNGSDPDQRSLVVAALAESGMENETISLDKNHGFTYAVNRGLGQLHGEHALILNNDCFVSAGCVQSLLAWVQTVPRLAVVAPRCSGPGYNSDATIPEGDGLRWSSVVGFCCALIDYSALGLLDESFTNGLGADDDYCDRARERGYMVAHAMNAWAEHLGRQTFRRHNIPRDCSLAARQLRAKRANSVRVKQP